MASFFTGVLSTAGQFGLFSLELAYAAEINPWSSPWAIPQAATKVSLVTGLFFTYVAHANGMTEFKRACVALSFISLAASYAFRKLFKADQAIAHLTKELKVANHQIDKLQGSLTNQFMRTSTLVEQKAQAERNLAKLKGAVEAASRNQTPEKQLRAQTAGAELTGGDQRILFSVSREDVVTSSPEGLFSPARIARAVGNLFYRILPE